MNLEKEILLLKTIYYNSYNLTNDELLKLKELLDMIEKRLKNEGGK